MSLLYQIGPISYIILQIILSHASCLLYLPDIGARPADEVHTNRPVSVFWNVPGCTLSGAAHSSSRMLQRHQWPGCAAVHWEKSIVHFFPMNKQTAITGELMSESCPGAARVKNTHMHLSPGRGEGGRFRCIINSVIFRQLRLTHFSGTLTASLAWIFKMFGALCVSAQGSWGLFFFFFSFCVAGGGLYGRVERHSPCPVFTSLQFKWSRGRLRLPFTLHHLHFPSHSSLTAPHNHIPPH